MVTNPIDAKALTDKDILELARDNEIISACCAVWRHDRLNAPQALRLMVAHMAEAMQRQRIAALKDAILAPPQALAFDALAERFKGCRIQALRLPGKAGRMKPARNKPREMRARLRGSIARRWAVALNPAIPPFWQDFLEREYREFIAHYPKATEQQKAAIVRFQRGPTISVERDHVGFSFDAPGGAVASFGEFVGKITASAAAPTGKPPSP